MSPTDPTRVLFLFSSTLELEAAFADGLPEGVLVGTTGVGPIDAAIGTSRVVAASDADAVVFIGTCGAHRDSGLAIGDVVYATTIRLGSGDVARGEMRIPSILPFELTCDEELGRVVAESVAAADGAKLAAARVSCTLGVTESDELAETLARYDGSQVENLEAFSVAHAVAHAERPRPVAVVLGVTNMVGAGGGRDWFANYRTLMSRLSHCVVARATRATEGA